MLYSWLWPLHGILMGLSFLSLLSGIIVSLFFKRSKWRIPVHRRLGLIGAACGLAGILVAFIMIQAAGGYHLTGLHALLGSLTGLLMILNPVIGLNLAKFRNPKRMRKLHRLIGYAAMVLMTVTVILGLRFAFFLLAA